MSVRTIVLGGTGYVAGELLRLLAAHPHLAVEAVVSFGSPGEAVEHAFPNLAGAYRGLSFADRAALPSLLAGDVAVFSAGPHGESAAQIDQVLTAAERNGANVRVVDLSADFRHPDAATFERIYGVPHGAPQRLAQFKCAVPEHAPATLPQHGCQPGCFTTAVVLPVAGLIATGLIEPGVFVSAVTGSTGAGKTPRPTTHHPERQGNLFAYNALTHRHQPEMAGLVERATGTRPDIRFVPHAGPFARGIHATIHAALARDVDAKGVAAALADHYRNAPFVTVGTELPQVKWVTGSNRCRIGVAVSGRALVCCSVIDNLVKGAAGGAVQWMNKLFGFDETAGLTGPGIAWT